MPALRYRLFFFLLLLIAGPMRAQQLAPPPADCLIRMLGRPAGDSAVTQTFQALGLTPPSQPGGLKNIRQGVLVTVDRKGLIESIAFLNDSLRVGDELYRGYRGELPFGFTLADSLGIEENRLFNEEAAFQVARDIGFDGLARYVAGVKTESGGFGYRMEMRFMPARDYFELKRAAPGLRNLKRTYWYRFRREEAPVRGKYLDMPLQCDGAGSGSYTARSRYLATDSVWAVKLEVNVNTLGRGFLKEDLQATGLGVKVLLHAPLSRRYSPPIRQQFGFGYSSHDYKGFSDLDNPPSLKRYSLIYGLYAQPRRGLAQGSWGGLYPYLEAQLTGDLFVNDRIADNAQRVQEPANATWGTQAAAGLVYKSGSFMLGTGAAYAYCRRARYIGILRDGTDIYELKKLQSAYRAVSVQFWVGFSFLGS